jgi:hypothetical protein
MSSSQAFRYALTVFWEFSGIRLWQRSYTGWPLLLGYHAGRLSDNLI